MLTRVTVVASLVLALACTKKNPRYCETDVGCMGGHCDKVAHECSNVDAGTDVSDARDAADADARDAVDAVDLRPHCTDPQCADGGFDGAFGVCEPEAGVCVQCLGDDDCSVNKKKPICDTQACRACRSDSECPDPSICMTDGHCATGAEVIFVQFNSSGCSGGMGTSANPYCTPNEAVDKLALGKNVIAIRGALADRLTLNTTGLAPVIVGKSAASIPATAATAIQVLSDNVLIRDLVVTGGTAPASKGVVVSGSSTTLTLSNVQVNIGTGLGIQADTGAHLTMDRCTVTGNSAGGLLVNGGGYDVQNSVFAADGGTTGYGVQLSAVLSGAQFSFTTIVGNPVAATCDLTNAATVRDSIVAGPVINCNVTNSITTSPTFDSARPYHLTSHLACLMPPMSPPAHDIDNQPRTAPVDCGADQFVP